MLILNRTNKISLYSITNDKMLAIRKLQENEKAEILNIGRQIFREEDEIPLLRKALALCSPDLSMVAVDNNQIIGFTLVCSKTPTNYYFDFMKRIPNCYELAFLGISPLAQGRGLGTRLLKDTLAAIFQGSKPSTCWLLVDTINEGAIKLYKKIGFRCWRQTDAPLTPLPGYIMGIHARRFMRLNQIPTSIITTTIPFKKIQEAILQYNNNYKPIAYTTPFIAHQRTSPLPNIIQCL